MLYLFSALTRSHSTTATIQPKSLISPSHYGQPIESKMVDFVMYLKPDQKMIERMRHMATAESTPFSVNHTLHSPLRIRPIGVNIETKLTGTGWDAANIQIAIWVAAQFTRLEQLLLAGGGEHCVLALPVIIIQGHNWNFLAVTRNLDRKTVRILDVWSV